MSHRVTVTADGQHVPDLDDGELRSLLGAAYGATYERQEDAAAAAQVLAEEDLSLGQVLVYGIDIVE